MLTCEQITKKYGSNIILNGLSYALESGKISAIYGDSGCGKTTLLNILAGLDTPDTGEVFWGHQLISATKPSDLTHVRAQYLGFVFQSYYLVPELNVFENVILPRRFLGRVEPQHTDRALQHLDAVGLTLKKYEKVEHLSGGERQRVAIARALINDPKIIFADEPTGNLDEKTSCEIFYLLCKLCHEHGKTLLLVTHNQRFAQLADRRHRLHEGVLLES